MSKLCQTLIRLVPLFTLIIATPIFAETSLEPNTHDTAIMDVYKSPTCGCCQKWVDYMADNGVASKVVEMDDLTSLKTDFGIAGQYRSCHTGVVTTTHGTYVFEGHVPAEYVKQFLADPPQGAIGLSVPGMPIGSPGMEVGNRKDYYQVLLLQEDGTDQIYAHVNAE